MDGGAIRQAVLNLLLNACAASPVGGRVRSEASMSDGALRFVISDEGPGLPASLLRDLLTSPDQHALPEGPGTRRMDLRPSDRAAGRHRRWWSGDRTGALAS